MCLCGIRHHKPKRRKPQVFGMHNFSICILLLFRSFVNIRSRSFGGFSVLLHSFAFSFTLCSIFAIPVHNIGSSADFFGNFALSLDREKRCGIITSDGIPHADLAHLVERHLAKVEVAGSSPVIRSITNTTDTPAYRLCFSFMLPTDRFSAIYRYAKNHGFCEIKQRRRLIVPSPFFVQLYSGDA